MKLGVEKSGVEMSFNLLKQLIGMGFVVVRIKDSTEFSVNQQTSNMFCLMFFKADSYYVYKSPIRYVNAFVVFSTLRFFVSTKDLYIVYFL